MEHLGTVGVNPQVQKTVKTFQSTAMKSLRGPSMTSFSGWSPLKTSHVDVQQYEELARRYSDAFRKTYFQGKTDFKTTMHPYGIPPYFTNPMMPVPFLVAIEPNQPDHSETNLEGQLISSFHIGGERRLCLPQILNTLLKPFTMDEVHLACSDLNIYFSRCNTEQLKVLKMYGVLPENAPSCGLITKTDASRLCHKLLYSCPDKVPSVSPSPNSFYVYHECFGKCKGLIIPELYIHPNAKCIRCSDCEGFFSPPTFVCHSHKSLENRTCHWGFDSSNWRSYLLLAKHQSYMIDLEQSLDDIKSRFDPVNPYKRKEVSFINIICTDTCYVHCCMVVPL